jgi:hypothetical protein
MTHLHGGLVTAQNDGNPVIFPGGFTDGLHLYIAVENLTDVIARRIQRERNLVGRSELAADLGLRPRAGEDFVRDGEIRGCLRREYIFDSNAEAHAKMKRLKRRRGTRVHRFRGGARDRGRVVLACGG